MGCREMRPASLPGRAFMTSGSSTSAPPPLPTVDQLEQRPQPLPLFFIFLPISARPIPVSLVIVPSHSHLGAALDFPVCVYAYSERRVGLKLSGTVLSQVLLRLYESAPPPPFSFPRGKYVKRTRLYSPQPQYPSLLLIFCKYLLIFLN